MFCTKCGTKIYDGDKFCTQCGTPAIREDLCPNCQSKLPEGAIYCGQCGTKVKNAPQPAPAPVVSPAVQPEQPTVQTPEPEPQFQPSPIQPVQPIVQAPAPEPQFQPSPVQPVQPQYQPSPAPAYASPISAQPQKYSMISKYIGEPSVGIAKATGPLLVYPDRLEYTKSMGNALGNLSLVTMAAAAHAAKKDGKVEVYYYANIKNAYVGKYMGITPTVVIVLNDGQVLSFTGTFTNQSASSIVNTILSYKSSHP